jgi:hypothetical protein
MKKQTLLTLVFVAVAVQSALAQTKAFPTVKDLMTPEEFKATGLSKLNDRELAALDVWVEKHSLKVAQVVAHQAGGASKDALSFVQLEGCSIVADDGEFLGIISKNAIDAKSILNEIGKHGSRISSASIFNSIAKYGSEISAYSPFYEIASKPPKIFNSEGKFVAYLTKNTLKAPRVDPHALIGWLKSK